MSSTETQEFWKKYREDRSLEERIAMLEQVVLGRCSYDGKGTWTFDGGLVMVVAQETFDD